MNFKKTWKRANDGFTLVELIVVIAILAILAGIAVPAYSGYIKKANEAADAQLLSAVNTAFAAACLENNKDINEFGTGEVTVRISDGKIASVSEYFEAFKTYFDIANSSFKEYTALKFVNDGVVLGFQKLDLPESWASLLGTFSDDDVTALFGSSWAGDGINGLLGDVNQAAALAAFSGNAKLDSLINDDTTKSTLYGYLGFDDESEEYFSLISDKAKKLAQTAGVSVDQFEDDAAYEDYLIENGYFDNAEKELLTNAAALNAVTNPKFDVNTFVTQLGNGEGRDVINSNLSSDPQTALSQSAFAYAMYTSYIANTDAKEPEGGATMQSILDTIKNDPNFRTYMKDTEGAVSADIEGYMGAMNMVGTAAGNDEVVVDMLVNGFASAELSTLLSQLTPKSGS